MIRPSSIEHDVVSQLIKAGFSPEAAAFYWDGIDRSGSVDDIVDRIMERVLIDASEEACAAEPSLNSAEPVPEHRSAQKTPPHTAAASGVRANFEVPLEEEKGPPSGGSTGTGNVIDLSPQEEERWGGFLSAVEETNYEEDDPPLDDFPLQILPATLKHLVEEIMRRLRIPALLPVACVLAVISVALGRGLKALSNKGWTFSNIFVLLGADSGTGKTFAYDAAMKPVNEIQHRLAEDAADIKAHLIAELKLIETSISALQRKYKKGEEKEVDRPEAEKQNAKQKLATLCREKTDLEDQLSNAFRIFTSDFTAEALGGLLQHNNEIIGACSDEATIQIDNLLGRYNEGKTTDDALLCKCFSVNAHAIDRISRGQILLKNPCVALLFLCQPDTFRKAFSNERLLMGGFLARCLAADTRLQMQEEDEESENPFNSVIEAEWGKFITDLFNKFHGADPAYILQVDPRIRALSRALHNRIVGHVRTHLADAQSFAARWVEQTWKIAELLHVGLYQADCALLHVLSPETFQDATRITDYFAVAQMEALRNVRADRLDNVHNRLQELFLQYDNKPITLRKLVKRHKLLRSSILSCVKSHSETYGIVTKRLSHGGKPSTIIYLQNGEQP